VDIYKNKPLEYYIHHLYPPWIIGFKCMAAHAAVCGSAVVCDSAAVCVTINVTVCSSAHGSVRQSGIVYGSASGSVRQCMWGERQCLTVRAAACAVVCGSAAVCVNVTVCSSVHGSVHGIV
jgi:hypothetical protein